jgi:histidine triad (HIT) family protein
MTCLFCKIVAGEIPAQKIHEDEWCIGFYDLHPQAPTHVLFVPKKHLSTLNDADESDRTILGSLSFAAAQFAKAQGFAEAGYRTVINTNAHGGQTVFHIHLHLLAGRHMQWPPG